MSTGLILLITGVISIGLAIVAECSTGDRKKWFWFLSVSFLGVFMAFVARDIWRPLEDGDRETAALQSLSQTKLALDGNSVVNSGLLRDEVMRQVVDECDFYLQHQGNRIDFDPLEAEEMRIQIHLSKPVERNALRDRIREVVRFQPSFYKRSLMYNAYYLLCIQQIGAAEAEGVMLQVMSTPNVPNSIAEADAVIQSLYDPQGDQRYAERARRDRAKIEVLRFIEADEADPSVRRKLESVIQELVYDIELWEL